MKARNLATPKATAEILKKYGFRPLKRLGQHFLVDANVLNKIVAAAELSKDDVVLEIGPGIGTLTGAMAPLAGRIVAVERDSRLIPILNETLEGLGNVEVVLADALEFNPERPPAGISAPNKCVSNLPYQVATPILAKYVERYPGIELYVVMIQREVGDRLLARPGSKDYGAVTVKLQYFCRIQPVMNVSRHVFMPKPEVDSVVIKFERLPSPAVRVSNEQLFFEIVRAAFAQRRKTLKRSLASGLSLPPDAIKFSIDKAGIDPDRRGESLSLEEFASISNALG